MNNEEINGLIEICVTAYRQPASPRDAMVWAAALGDMPFGLARAAVVEWVRTSPYWPRPADIRERARLIDAQAQRQAATRRQLDDRGQRAITAVTATPAARQRTGANMVRHVLGRLKDAGQDTTAGQFLGKERAKAVALTAVDEWLERTKDAPATTRQTASVVVTACPNCYRPHQEPPGTWCPACLANPEPTGDHRDH